MTGPEHYLDTSALLPYYREAPASRAVEEFLQSLSSPVKVSRLAEAELAAALAGWVSAGELDEPQALLIENAYLEDLRAGLLDLTPVPALAYGRARDWLLKRAVPLDTLDALHLAACHETGAELVTCDEHLHKAAVQLAVRSRLLA